MKILALIGSPRKEGNTDILVDQILKGAKTKGHTSEKLYLYQYKISPCIDCRRCKKGEHVCPIKDGMQKIYPEIAGMKKILVILFIATLLMGCAHRVDFRSPDKYQSQTAVPLNAIFYMDQSMKDKSWSGRAVGSGVANRWDVPIGKVVDQYANAYLKNGFNSFSEIENLIQKPPHDILIKITDINYCMSSQAAHCDLAFSIENAAGGVVFDKKYHEDGPSGAGRIFVGGVFAQKSAIRQSTHVVLENIFKKLLAEIQANYTDWSK